MAVISLDDVWKFYGNFPALKQVTLSLEPRSCCALLGRNGAGKTTLLRVLAGLSPFQRGSIEVLGSKVRSAEARKQTGFLGHGIGVYEDLTARENLRFFANAAGAKLDNTALSAWLKRVDLARVADLPVRQFSRGMRQRLALARTFQHQPNLFLLDEPFTSLDDRSIAMLGELLAEAQMRGATMVLSTHQIREALAIASHVALLDQGELRYFDRRTIEMVEDPRALYRIREELGIP
jgi:heme ABC exporter ATP-binding subunit CcmA